MRMRDRPRSSATELSFPLLFPHPQSDARSKHCQSGNAPPSQLQCRHEGRQNWLHAKQRTLSERQGPGRERRPKWRLLQGSKLTVWMENDRIFCFSRGTRASALTHGATLPYGLNVLHVIVMTFSTIVAYQKARETRITGCKSLSHNPRPAAGMSTRQIPPQLTHAATLSYRLNVLHVIALTFSTIVAYQKCQRIMHNGL